MKLVVSGRMFTPDGVVEGYVKVENGIITRVGEGRISGSDVLEFSEGELILPGLIDMHVHMRDFDQAGKEDFTSGTSAAAAGGFTVVVDMPNTTPPVNRREVLVRRESVAREKAVVDYGLYYGIPRVEGELGREVLELAVGFKLFMQKDYYSESRSAVLRALSFAAENRALVVVHAENPELYTDRGMGPAGTPEAEASAISEISRLSEGIGLRTHITHLSSAKGVEELKRWKGRIGITSDTCPGYLLLTREDVERIGPVAKVHPPIKEPEDREALLRSLRQGLVDAVSSDHAPHLPEEKKEFRSASPGFPGLETTLPLMLSLVNRGILKLEDVVRMCAEAPAKILGLERWGSIEEGKMGSLTVMDVNRRWRIDARQFVSKAKYSPFDGFEVVGAPVATVVRGRLVMKNGKVIGDSGWGRNVRSIG